MVVTHDMSVTTKEGGESSVHSQLDLLLTTVISLILT